MWCYCPVRRLRGSPPGALWRWGAPESVLTGYPTRGRTCDRFCSKRNHCELIPTTVVICLNLFSPKSDHQYQFSPDNVTTVSREKVMRIYKIITKEEILVSKLDV